MTKLVLNNNKSKCLCRLPGISFAMTSKVRIKRKNFKINREGGRFKKISLKAEDLPLYRKTWQICHCANPMGGSKRWTLSETADNRQTIVTLPSVLSAVCIAQN